MEGPWTKFEKEGLGLSNIGGRVGGLYKTGKFKIPLPATLMCRVLEL